MARLFADTGVITLTSFISPYRQDSGPGGRQGARLYRHRRPCEPPLVPERVLHDDRITPLEGAARVIAYLQDRGLLP